MRTINGTYLGSFNTGPAPRKAAKRAPKAGSISAKIAALAAR